MIFKILATGKSSSITSTPNIGYLIEDQWDDWFQYSTMYDLYVVDSSSQKQYMGKVKIGQRAWTKDNGDLHFLRAFLICQKISSHLVKTATIMKISKTWVM